MFLINPTYRGSVSKQIEEKTHSGKVYDRVVNGLLPRTRREKSYFTAMSAAKQCRELCKEAEIVYPETEYSRIESFSDQQRKDVVKRLGEQGLVSVSDDMNMENYQKMLDFYSAYVSGRDAMVTVFSVSMKGNTGALTFIHRNGKIQSFYVSIGWREGGIPEIKGFGSNALDEIRLTEKGYFI